MIFNLFLPVKMNENPVANQFKCSCKAQTIIKSLNRLCTHVQYNHFERDDSGQTIYICPDENCKNKNIKGAQNIKRHFERNHFLDVKFSCLFDEPQSSDAQPDRNQSNIVQNCEPLPDFDDASSDVPMDYESTSAPVLLVNQQFNELSLEDQLCSLIISHKKAYPGITTKACLGIAEDWRKFYSAYLDRGKITL